MKFATLSHLLNENNIKQIPQDWIKKDYIISPELNIGGTKGYVIALKLLPKQVMENEREHIRTKILDAALIVQDKYNVDVVQLGALTTSVTNGGKWLVNQKTTGLVNNPKVLHNLKNK